MDKKLINTAGKFVVIGALSTAVNYSIFYFLLKYLGVNYLVSSATGYIGGLIVGFFLNNFWTFGAEKIRLKHTIGYVLVYLFSLGLSTLFLWVSVTLLHFDARYMNVLSIVLTTISNFIGLKYMIYNGDTDK